MTIQPFAIGKGTYFAITLTSWLSQWWWSIALPMAICGACATFDLRFLFLALILIFLVAPMVVMMLYFSYILAPQALYSIMPKTLTICDDHIILHFVQEEKKDSEKDTQGDETTEQEEAIPYKPLPDVTLQISSFGKAIIDGDNILLPYRNHRHQYLVIPRAAFKNAQQFSEFYQLFS